MGGRVLEQIYGTTRQWTTEGCVTEWSKAREDMVYVTCDHMIDRFSNGLVGGYQMMGLEILRRPSYVEPVIEWANRSWHNNITYWLLFLWLLPFFFMKRFAKRSDQSKFWPSEQTLLQILFLIAEQDRLLRLRDHDLMQEIAREEAKDPFYKILRKRKLKPVILTEGVPVAATTMARHYFEFFFKVTRANERVQRWYRRRQKLNMIKREEWRMAVWDRDEDSLTNEVREMRSMRLQLRNRLYEHFFQQTELHPDDIEIDGQEVRIRTNDDLLGSSQASSSEEEDVEEEEEAMEPPPLPGVEDVIFDNEEEDSALKALAAGFEDMMGEDTGPALPPGWETVVNPDTGEVRYRNLLTDFRAADLPHEPAWGGKPLLPGWMLCYSSQHDRAYFFFPTTQATQWEFPIGHTGPG